jgi:N-acetylmuramoyl-L-alanine amidase
MKRMLHITKLTLAFFGCCFASFAFAASPVTLKTIRVSESPVTAQVLLEFSQDFEYEGFELHNPERYVVDLYKVKLGAAVPDEDLPAPLSRLRASANSEKLRLVLDLEHNVKPRLTKQRAWGHSPPRLSIDISRQAMKASSGAVTTLSKFSRKIAEHARDMSNPGSFEVSGDALKNLAVTTAVQPENLGDLPQPHSIKAPKARDVVVVIDPGHGGKDPGAKGATGTQEKDVVLAIAKRLQAQINRQPGFRAVLTRNGDYFIGLRNRLALARKYQGDMFIAIHADAHEHLNACGVGIYALSQRGATSEAARWLAQQENQSEFVGGLDLTDKDQVLRSVLIDLSQTQSITASLQMGSVLLDNLGQFAQLHHNKVEQAAFVVLKSPDIPSLLIETGFISNSAEELRLGTPYYQERIAVALWGGIKNYFVKHPPRGSWLALSVRKNYDV